MVQNEKVFKMKRIYPSTQLIVALDARVLKVYLWILSWSATGSVKFYPRQFAKACKMEENEVERCIQSLEDAKLVDISKVDQTWVLTPNEAQNQKYYQIPISKVLEGKGIMMADNVTWNVDDNKEELNMASMSDEQLERMIKELQRRKSEKKGCQVIYPSGLSQDELLNQLPF